MKLAFTLPLLISYLLGVLLLLMMGRKAHEKEQESYSFLNRFPYELYGDSRGVYPLFARIGEGIALLCDALLPALLLYAYHSSLQGSAPSYLGGIVAFTFLFVLAYLFLSLVPASNEKAHLSLFFASAALSTMSFTMDGLFLIVLIRSSTGKDLLYLFAVLLFALALATIFLPFHPKMKRWAELERVSEKDGSVSFRRPRFFILAFQEWLLSLLRMIGYILALVGFLLASL